jgi:hypothetical protein
MRMVRDFNFMNWRHWPAPPGGGARYRTRLSESTALAGYLIEIKKGQAQGTSRLPARFRFNPARNTGPRPPMIQRTKAVYDPNLGQVVWQEEPDHDC